MTRKDQRKREAALRALDVLIATKVMGWHVVIDYAFTTCNEMWYGVEDGVACFQAQKDDLIDCDGVNRGGGWHPSECLEHAWQVVERFAPYCHLVRQEAGSRHAWMCNLTELTGADRIDFGERAAYADTVPLAICFAALKAVGVEVSEVVRR